MITDNTSAAATLSAPLASINLFTAIMIVLILVAIVIIYFGGALGFPLSQTVMVTAKDGNKYYVLDRADKKQAVEILAKLNRDIIEFLRWLKVISVNLPPGHQRIIGAMLRGYNFETIRENNPRNLAGDTSYTVRKGESMYMCLRQRDDTSKFIPYNVLMYVALHEISHIGHYSGWGHGSEFWQVFLLVLRLAVRYGVYQPVNYAAQPVIYCGLNINYCPLFDPSIGLPRED